MRMQPKLCIEYRRKGFLIGAHSIYVLKNNALSRSGSQMQNFGGKNPGQTLAANSRRFVPVGCHGTRYRSVPAIPARKGWVASSKYHLTL
jgi:hypothetical protein